MLLTILWVLAVCAAVCLYLRQHYSYFSRRGVTTPPYLPLVGHLGKMLLKKEHVTDQLERFYIDYPEDRFVGRFELLRPAVLIRDIELIKKIVVKDFDHFINHRSVSDETTDPWFSRNLFSLKGQEWRDMRSKLSPAFTSSKMRHMVPLMLEVGDQVIKAMKQKIRDTETGYFDMEVKDMTSRYSNDVIATCSFGLKVDSHTERDNQLYAMGKLITTFEFSYKQYLLLFVFTIFPKLMKILKFTTLPKKSNEFFHELVLGTMRTREEKNIIRPDMIHLLMEAKKGRLTHDEKSKDLDTGFTTVEESQIGKKTIDKTWSDPDLTAQAILFFMAGYETVSTSMAFLLYELAVDPDVQERLAQEIKDNDAQHGGKFDFNSVQNMVYMDMVISEVLRKWPPVPGLDRECLKDYNCGKPNSKAKEDYILPKGMGVGIPVWGIHRDRQFYPDPYKFDPERFSEQNRHKINPFAYMPFGLGPRNCVASRFSLCEMKVMTYQLLQHLQVSPCEKTTIPAVLDPAFINAMLKGGTWLRFKERK